MDEMSLDEKIAVRSHLALALDTNDASVALELIGELASFFSIAKVGLELFSACGPSVVSELIATKTKVFVDLKLHDIPTTVGKAARALGQLGASYVTMHASGGYDMLAAGVEGLREGATSAGLAEPVALAVTVLTSDELAPAGLITERTELAERAGCHGVVCAATDLDLIVGACANLLKVVPGIRLPGGSHDDQARVASPEQALRAGADLLVVGRAVTGASDRVEAASAIFASARGGL